MIVLFIFVCGGLGVLAAARKDMFRSLTDLFCQSFAVYVAILTSGAFVELVPDIPLPFGDMIRVAGSLIVIYVIALIVLLKLFESVIEYKKALENIELPVPELADKIYSKGAGFLSGCVIAYLLLILIVWAGFSFKLPAVGEKSFRDSVQAHVTFFTGTMNVFTWSSSYAPQQKKMLHKLFPVEEVKVVRNDKLSSLSEEDKRKLKKKSSAKIQKKKKLKKRKKIRKTEKNRTPELKETERKMKKDPPAGAVFFHKEQIRTIVYTVPGKNVSLRNETKMGFPQVYPASLM